MTMTTHERPGVYSAYEVSAVVTSVRRRGIAGVVALSAAQTTAGTLCQIDSYDEAVTAFGAEDAMTALVRLLLLNGVRRIFAVPVSNAGGYAAAFSLIQAQPEIKTVLCDSTDKAIQKSFLDSVEAASAVQRERIGVLCGLKDETAAQLVTRAQALNSERLVLVAPTLVEGSPAAVAAAVAAAICTETDPAVPLGGARLKGLSGLSAQYKEQEIDTLLKGGVTPIELVGGECMVVRGVTTRTTTGGVPDKTWQELGTVLVIDDVIPSVRDALHLRFTRAKNTPQVRDAIRSQVILELERKKTAEIITDYGEVTAEATIENPTVCLVGFSFSVAHGLNQIWLQAQITV